MGAIHYKKAGIWRRGLIALLCLLALNNLFSDLSAQPMLGMPKPAGPYFVHIPLYNCDVSNVQYIVEMSTNLTTWIPVATNSPSPTNTATVFFTNAFAFYRLFVFPPVGRFLGIVCKTNFDMKGENFVADSFDSSNPLYSTGGQYDVTKREANVKVAGFIITNSLVIQNGNVFGYVCTSSGRALDSAVFLGLNGSVGDLAWVSNNTPGIEAGHWTSNYNISIPDVPAPNTTGWATSLPPVTTNNGIVAALLPGGTNYVVSALSIPLVISGDTVMWVKGTCSLGVTFTNNARLILYVGNTTGTAAMVWSGNSTINMPGYASNFQIYGLPSLISADLHGNSGWVGTLYAPEANLTAGGPGNNIQDTSGAIVVKALSLKGKWNFHFDQALAQP